jgi:hypothetical protein
MKNELPIDRIAVAQRRGAKVHAVVADPSPYLQDVSCGRQIVQFDEVGVYEAESLNESDWCPACYRAFLAQGGVAMLKAKVEARRAARVRR